MTSLFFPLALPNKKIGYAQICVTKTPDVPKGYELFPSEAFALPQARQAFGAFFPEENDALRFWWKKYPSSNTTLAHEWRGASATLSCLLAAADCVRPFRLSRSNVWASGLVFSDGGVSVPSMLPEKLEILLSSSVSEMDGSNPLLGDTVFLLPASGYDALAPSLERQKERVEAVFWPKQVQSLDTLRFAKKSRSIEDKLLLIFFPEKQIKELIEWLQGREKRSFRWRRWLGILGLLSLLLASSCFMSQDICQSILRPVWPNLVMDYKEICKRRVIVARACGSICRERCRFLGRFGSQPPPCHFACSMKELHNICIDHSPGLERCGEQEIERLAGAIGRPKLLRPISAMSEKKTYREKIDHYCNIAESEIRKIR
ncbi:hypothetical protein L6R29_17745 [Myxococcota bacterium]|nr:hypothetical protein [Myxococcota bacterium]